MSCQLIELLGQTRRPKILVVGDVMLDRYLRGDVERISPEAPIPILRVDKQESRLGGAGSVVTMLAAMDADVLFVSVTADDPDGKVVRKLIEEQPAVTDCTLIADGRSTSVKERLLGRTLGRHSQQMMRVDREDTQPIPQPLAAELLKLIERLVDDVDVVLVSDYDKGVCAGQFVVELVKAAQCVDTPVVVDPACAVDYGRYAGSTCITPNRNEAGLAVDRRISTVDDGLDAARQLLTLGVKSAVVTLDRDGIAWADADGRSQWFPVRPRQVYDITGAGDMVLAALGYALASGADWPTSIELANLAGGLEIERLGTSPLTREELLAELSRSVSPAGEKLVSLEQLDRQLQDRRRTGQQIVMTNGCFDLLHPGHVALLQFARAQGDCLVVGLNSDRSVRRLKGEGRPILNEQGRAEMLTAMGCVDFVVSFDDVSVAGLVERVAPHVLVKSAEYDVKEVVGHEIVEAYGGKVVLAPVKDTYSTSNQIDQIAAASRRKPEK